MDRQIYHVMQQFYIVDGMLVSSYEVIKLRGFWIFRWFSTVKRFPTMEEAQEFMETLQNG